MNIQDRIFAKNEKEANLFAIKLNYCIILIVSMVFANCLLQNLEEVALSTYAMYGVMLAALLGMNLYIRLKHGVGSHIKYLELALLIFCAIWNTFIFNLIWWGYFYIPIILSTRYGKYAFTGIVGAVSSLLGMATAFAQIPYGLKTGYFNLNYVAVTQDITINIHKGYYGLVDAVFTEHPELIDMTIAYKECLYESMDPFGISVAITIMCAFMAKYDRELVMVEIANAELAIAMQEKEKHNVVLQDKNEEITALNEEQQAQIEEINALNAQLEEQQAMLEENQALLEQAKVDAEQANEAKTKFLNNMSHDIRTPMNAVLGFTRLMKKDLNNTALLKNYIGKIESSGEYLLSIINNVLDIARIDSGKIELQYEDMDLNEQLVKLQEVFSGEADKKQQEITVTSNIRHAHVKADISKLTEIMLNLISNAIKYTPVKGRISVTLDEVLSMKAGYADYVFTITDNGIGMSEDFIRIIFDDFTRAKNSTDSKVMGTGLGMSIVKRLVDLMGGTISVESELNVGSTFRVMLPLAIVVQGAQDTAASENTETENMDFTGKRILLAEDNELNAEIAIAILEDLGLQVEHAEDGAQCIAMLDREEAGYYDLVLMDVQMPNMNGYEATKHIRALEDKQKSGIPILAMTANAFAEDRRQALAAGMNGHLAKPIDLVKLVEALTKYLQPQAVAK